MSEEEYRYIVRGVRERVKGLFPIGSGEWDGGRRHGQKTEGRMVIEGSGVCWCRDRERDTEQSSPARKYICVSDKSDRHRCKVKNRPGHVAQAKPLTNC
jgi:hypothetical protein